MSDENTRQPPKTVVGNLLLAASCGLIAAFFVVQWAVSDSVELRDQVITIVGTSITGLPAIWFAARSFLIMARS
jgi:hypothetical protein